VRPSSSVCLQVTGLIESSIAQEPGAGRTTFLGDVRRVGTRAQIENNEWIGTSDVRVPPAEHGAGEINARPQRLNQLRSGIFHRRIPPRNGTARASTHSTMYLSFRPELFAVTTCARKRAVLLTSWADHGFTMMDSPTVREYSAPATSMHISPSSTV
jgi:hypothetical protein